MKDRDKQPISEPEKSVLYGVGRSDINRDRLAEVLRIYGEVAGASDYINRYGPEDFIDDMERDLDVQGSPGIDLRIGSKLTGHTKLMSCREWDKLTGERLIRFYMNPNIGYGEQDYAEGEQMAAQFDKALGEYLQSQGIARQIMKF